MPLLFTCGISRFASDNAFIETVHYANMPVSYTAIFHGCENDNFQMKRDIFLIFAQNIDH